MGGSHHTDDGEPKCSRGKLNADQYWLSFFRVPRDEWPDDIPPVFELPIWGVA